MINRAYWQNLIEQYWTEKSLIWLSGVRRVGKTSLARSIKNIEYFDCELPRVREMMNDPQAFLESLKGKRVVFDEVHRLENPSEILKIAADHYPMVKVIATGSSMLTASVKFKDSLTGRKRDIWLTPLNSHDLKDFHSKDLEKRFIQGGLPGFYLADKYPEKDIIEWVDAYWAKDILELFRLEKKYVFIKFFELLMAQSGGMFVANKMAQVCDASRQTLMNYLAVLESTYVISVIRPFHSHKPREIISAPKVYGFDTAFVAYYKGWSSLRKEDYGLMWEHFVLNEIQSRVGTKNLHYWRNKQGDEIDFVIAQRGDKSPIAIECKWKSSRADIKPIEIFLKEYPHAEVFIVATDIQRSYKKTVNNGKVQFVSLEDLISQIS